MDPRGAVPNTPGSEESPDKTPEGQKIVRASTRILFDGRTLPDEGKSFRQALWDAQRLAATAANVLLRAHWKKDGELLDAYLAEHGHPPKKAAEWRAADVDDYQLIRRACPTLNTGIASAIARAVLQKWMQCRYEALVRQTRSPPHYKTTGAFPIRSQEVRFRPSPDGKATVMSFSLHSGRFEGGAEFRVPLVARDESQRDLLDKLVSGEWKHGNVLVEQDRLRPGKWYARIAYTRYVPLRQEGVAAAINKGIRTFVAAVTETGESWLYDGYDIEAYLKQIQRRRQRYQRDAKASGRWGHGRARTLRPIKPLLAKGENWRRTRCQVIARRLAEWLGARNVSRVYIEDFSGIRDGEPEKLEGQKYVWDRIQEWPYYQLQMRLQGCLEELGIAVTVVSAKYISQTCPRCGATDAKHRDLRFWKLRCGKCRYSRHLDVAAAHNVLARGEAALKQGPAPDQNGGPPPKKKGARPKGKR